MIQGNPPLYEETSLWEALSVVSQKWIPFPTALFEVEGDLDQSRQGTRSKSFTQCHGLTSDKLGLKTRFGGYAQAFACAKLSSPVDDIHFDRFETMLETIVCLVFTRGTVSFSWVSERWCEMAVGQTEVPNMDPW